MKTCECAKGQRWSNPSVCIQTMKNGTVWKLLSALYFRQLLNKLKSLENNVNYLGGNKYPLHAH